MRSFSVSSTQVRDKLTGKDFNKEESLKAKEQVWCPTKLISLIQEKVHNVQFDIRDVYIYISQFHFQI